MTDKIREVGKSLRKTRENSEAALRRYNVKHPRIERARDIFDDVIPFEMEFKTESQDSLFSMDVFFNKPPPLRNCKFGRFVTACTEFTVPAGDHLLNLGESYVPGSVTVFSNGTELSSANYYEYSPSEGLVFVQAPAGVQIISICFNKDTWITCPPSFVAPPFESVQGAFTGIAGDWNSHSSNSFGAFVHSIYPGGLEPHPGNTSDFSESNLSADLTGIELPDASNSRLTWTFSVTSDDLGGGGAEARILGGFGSSTMQFRLLNADGESGFYISLNGEAFQKISDATQATVTVDNNVVRGSMIIKTLWGDFERAAHNGSFTVPVIYHFSATNDTPIGSEASGALTYFAIGCSLEP